MKLTSYMGYAAKAALVAAALALYFPLFVMAVPQGEFYVDFSVSDAVSGNAATNYCPGPDLPFNGTANHDVGNGWVDFKGNLALDADDLANDIFTSSRLSYTICVAFYPNSDGSEDQLWFASAGGAGTFSLQRISKTTNGNPQLYFHGGNVYQANWLNNNDGQLVTLCQARDGNEHPVWENSTLQSNGTRSGSFNYNQLTIGAQEYGGALSGYVNINVTRIALFNDTLTPTEVSNFHSGTAPTNCAPTNLASVLLNNPADNDHDNTNPQTSFNYNLSQRANITLWTNTSGGGWVSHTNASSVEVDAGDDLNFTGPIYLSEGSIQWRIEASNENGSINSSTRTIVQDYTAPTLNVDGGEVAADNSTAWNFHLDGDAIDVHTKVSDSYVYGYNITISGNVSGEVFTEQNTSITGEDFGLNYTFNISTYPGDQLWVVEVVGSDDHTKKAIENYTVDSSKKSKINFKTPNDNNIKVETRESSTITAVKEVDRYTFSMDFDDDATKRRVFDVKTDLCPLEYRVVSNYKAHFVSACGLEGNWLDFEGAGDNVSITKQDDYHYVVVVENLADNAVFRSVGGLNRAARNFTFTTSKTPVTPSIQSDDLGITWIYTNWTASTGANLYGIYRDGVNVANTSSTNYNHTGLNGGTSYTLGVLGIFNDSGTYYENATLSTINRQTIFNGSITAEVRNEINNKVLTGVRVFVNLIGTVNTTGNTTTGTIGLTNLSADNYTVRHSAIGWGSRDQYLEIVENQTGSIILYLINDSIRDPGRVYVRDTQSQPVNGSIVKLLRYFSDENLYRVVQMATTNDDGIAVMNAEAYDGWYKWVVEYSGVTEAIVNIPEFLSKDDDTLWRRTFNINIGNDFWESYRSRTDDRHAVTYNNATRALTYTWNDPDSIITEGCLKARWANGTVWTTQGPTCASGATGSVVLTLPNVNRTFFYTAYYDTSTTYSENVADTGTIGHATNWFSGRAGRQAGAFLGVMLLVGAGALFAFNAIIGMIMVAVLVALLSIPGYALLPLPLSAAIGTATIAIGFAVFAMRRS